MKPIASRNIHSIGRIFYAKNAEIGAIIWQYHTHPNICSVVM